MTHSSAAVLLQEYPQKGKDDQDYSGYEEVQTDQRTIFGYVGGTLGRSRARNLFCVCVCFFFVSDRRFKVYASEGSGSERNVLRIVKKKIGMC